MTHQEFDKRLEAALGIITQQGEMYGLDDIEKAKQAIRELFVEVVGEDKGWDVSKSDYGFKDQGKNELRQELRTTITGKEGGE